MALELVHDTAIRKERAAGEQEIERRSEAVDIAADIGLAGVLGLFGRDEVRSTHDRTSRRQVAACFDRVGIRQRLGREGSKSKVENLDRAIFRDHQVMRLDITMHHAAFVGMLQPNRGLPDVVTRVGNPQGTLVFHDL